MHAGIAMISVGGILIIVISLVFLISKKHWIIGKVISDHIALNSILLNGNATVGSSSVHVFNHEGMFLS